MCGPWQSGEKNVEPELPEWAREYVRSLPPAAQEEVGPDHRPRLELPGPGGPPARARDKMPRVCLPECLCVMFCDLTTCDS